MNRLIEFRVWDEDHKVMYDWDEISIEKDQVFCSDGDIYISYDHCILMQFTGLHDKNGKKIFEGDIVTWHFATEHGRQVRPKTVIAYDDIELRFKAIGANNLHKLRDVEIIGNIYENPNLCN